MKHILQIAKILLVLMLLSSCGKKTTETDIDRVTTPTFSLPGGVYYAAQTVAIACATAGANVYYTTDGSEPSSSSALYTAPLVISAVTTLKAKAYGDRSNPSATASAEYIIQPFVGVATPSFSPPAGTYSSGQVVSISCTTNGAKIYYSTDGSDPTITSALYSTPLVLNATTTLKAIANLEGLGTSAIAASVYTVNNLQTVGKPVFSLPEGVYTSSKTVAITCPTSGAQIRYTLDGSEPGQSSLLYSSPIVISSSLILKAKGFTAGWNPSISEIASYTINLTPTVDAPRFSHPTGVYNVGQTISINCSTLDAQIHYTTDGSEPTSNSALYASPFDIGSTTAVKARAFKEGMIPSPTSTAVYTIIVVRVPLPVFSLQGGLYYNEQTVSITCANPEAAIRYTTDGSDPTTSSPLYSNPVIIGINTTLKAKAYKAGLTESLIASAKYTISVIAPQFDLPGGEYHYAQAVIITCPTAGAQIRFTTNGSDPTINSDLYSNPLMIETTTKLKARAFKTGLTDSPIVSALYTINILTVASPKFSLSSGVYYSVKTVSISCVTTGAQIYYTTDGSDPSESSTLYTNPIEVSTNITLKAKAYKALMYASPISSATYSIVLPPVNMVYIPGGTFEMGSEEIMDALPYDVELSAFYLGNYEVSQAEWTAIMGTNPSYFTGDTSKPVEQVSWYSALVYCNLKSMNTSGFTPVYNIGGSTNPVDWGTIPTSSNATWNAVICDWSANGYRLPTEAEWEYAARGGTNASQYIYSGSDDINEVAWYLSNASNTSHPRGYKQANSLGLYDMSGNVYEWCWDRYGQYPIQLPIDPPFVNPTGAILGTDRVSRGGSWHHGINFSLVRYRSSFDPQSGSYDIGFRVCRSIPNKQRPRH